jgi:hypothetical protein
MSSKTPLFDLALDKILSSLAPHTRTCAETGEAFEITDKDIEFCRLLRVPPPTLTWWAAIRHKRAFVGGFDLFRRSASDGTSVVTMYDPESFAHFLPTETWHSDAFDPLASGFSVKPSESFLSQLDQLWRTFPWPALQRDLRSENSDWSNYFISTKNAYNCWETGYSEDVYYTDMSGYMKQCSDLFVCINCEWCYDDANCQKCYRVHFSEQCEQGTDLFFCLGCKSCSDCFGCTNLFHKSYCFLNEQLTPDAYRERLRAIDLSDSRVVEEWRLKIKQEYWSKAYRCGAHMQNAEQSLGDNITNSKDVLGISIWDSERVFKGILTVAGKDCYYTDGSMQQERCYSDMDSLPGSECRMTIWCCSCIDMEYSTLCTNCEHCFGCVGLRHKKFCILDKQYTEEEYWPLVDAIRTAMLERGEYGEFLPYTSSPLAYNNSAAMIFFPIEEQEARQLGARWYTFPHEATQNESADAIPFKLADTDDSILKRTFCCPVSGRAFRFVKPELEFHREMNLALPRVHPTVRRSTRAAQQFPMQLHPRTCAMCKTSMLSRIPPSFAAPVLCQECYGQAVIGEKEAPKM